MQATFLVALVVSGQLVYASQSLENLGFLNYMLQQSIGICERHRLQDETVHESACVTFFQVLPVLLHTLATHDDTCYTPRTWQVLNELAIAVSRWSLRAVVYHTVDVVRLADACSVGVRLPDRVLTPMFESATSDLLGEPLFGWRSMWQTPFSDIYPQLQSRLWYSPKDLKDLMPIVNVLSQPHLIASLQQELVAAHRSGAIERYCMPDSDGWMQCLPALWAAPHGWDAEVCTALLPTLCNALSRDFPTTKLPFVHAGQEELSLFGVQPGGRIQPHDDGTNVRINALMSLHNCQGRWIKAGGETRTFHANGEWIIWDASFSHEAGCAEETSDTQWVISVAHSHPQFESVFSELEPTPIIPNPGRSEWRSAAADL